MPYARFRRRTPRLTTCFDDLAEAIRAWAKGWLPTEAAAELLISHRAWLEREDFLQVAVELGREPFRARHVAAVGLAPAADAVAAGAPGSAGGARGGGVRRWGGGGGGGRAGRGWGGFGGFRRWGRLGGAGGGGVSVRGGGAGSLLGRGGGRAGLRGRPRP